MEAKHALDLLTEDCWREVFKKVWGPADLKCCYETCTTFESILERKKNIWMFPVILPHILQYLSLPVGPGANFWRRSWGMSNQNAMYTCRLVCKGWNQAVNHHLETQDYSKSPNGCEYWFYIYNDIREFREKYEDHVGNPFMGRFIRINHIGLLDPPLLEPDQNLPIDCILNLRQILTRFGNEIWTMVLEDCTLFAHLSFCKNIQILLGMLPNLKCLTLWPRATADQDLDQLPAFLAANPLPENPYLESLKLADTNIVMGRALLVKYGPQLKRLRLKHSQHLVENVSRFQYLEELEIVINNETESLGALRHLRSPLKSLHIHISRNDRRFWPIDELIRNVQHLPLTDLWIGSRNYFERTLSAFPESLQHGTIRRVKITSWTMSNQSCNFLRCFPNLEEVHLYYPFVRVPQPGYPDNLLIIKSSEEEMYKLPVWDVLPHLRTIAVEQHLGRPKEYKRSTFEMLRLEKTKEMLADLI